MIPASVVPSPYLSRSSFWKTEERRTQICAYILAKKSAIISKMTSVFKVLSNPGASTRVTVVPSRVNSSESWTSVVCGSEPAGSGCFEPLARLIN